MKKDDEKKTRKPHVTHPTPAETLNMKATQASTLAEKFDKKRSHIPIAQPKYTLDGDVKLQKAGNEKARRPQTAVNKSFMSQSKMSQSRVSQSRGMPSNTNKSTTRRSERSVTYSVPG